MVTCFVGQALGLRRPLRPPEGPPQLKELPHFGLLVKVLGAAALLAAVAPAAPGGFEERRDALLARQLESPLPNPACRAEPIAEDRCVWGKLDFALAALWLNRGAEDLKAANAGIREACARIPNAPGYKRYANPRDRSSPRNVDGAYDFHFITAALMTRAYELFRPRLEVETREAMEGLFWDYARSECVAAQAAPSETWRIWGSENHSAMRNGACWSTAKILRNVPAYRERAYDDGSTAAAQYRAWTAFLKQYIRERGKRGMLVEIFSPGYYVDTLQNFHNYYDFSDDAELRRLARSFLDLWWADWAQEQIGGIHGGSKARFYPNSAAAGTPGEGLTWLYLNIGAFSAKAQGPALMNMATSAYRVPEVVADIARDAKGRGVYEARSRRPGRAAKPWAEEWYTLDAERGGIYRYTWCTPAFIMGASMFGKLPDSEWTHISDQNRWQGIILDAGPEARIYALPAAPQRNRAYNQFWSVQSKATQIIQKIPEPLSRGAGPMRVWFGRGLPRVEEGGWVFVDSAAYVAVRPASGGYTWDAAEPRWMLPDEDLAPVIIQAALKSDFRGFGDFKAAVRKLPLEVAGGVVRFTGLGGAGRLTFYAESDRLPEIDGVAVNLEPPFTFDSPFLKEKWASGLVTISKGGRELALDFQSAEPGFVPLFDGETLRGWRLIGQCGSGYAVEDGTITIVPDELGNLFTEKEYANFILRFEFRLTPGANNGMAIRTPPIWERASREGMEIQILAEDNTRDTKPNHRHGSIYDVAEAKQGCLKPNGEWNQEEIVANGRRVTVKVNGMTALDLDLDSIRNPAILKEHPGLGRARGHIGFMGHYSRVWFRNIRIRELP